MWPLQLCSEEGVLNNAGTFVVTALAPFGPTDLERFDWNHTESKHLPKLPAYVEDWLLHVFLSVYVIETAQYLPDEHVCPKTLLDTGMLEVSGCWWGQSSSYLAPVAANSQRSPSIMCWWFPPWMFWMAEHGSCDKKRREGSSPGTRDAWGHSPYHAQPRSRGTQKLCCT